MTPAPVVVPKDLGIGLLRDMLDDNEDSVS